MPDVLAGEMNSVMKSELESLRSGTGSVMTHSISYRRILNRMGYYDYQNGLIYNHLNQEGGWDSHLDHCRNFINRALDYYKPEKVTVLGSGWLA